MILSIVFAIVVVSFAYVAFKGDTGTTDTRGSKADWKRITGRKYI